MQLIDAGNQVSSRPAPNATVSPGWANNAPSGPSAATNIDPDWANGLTAELQAIATLNGQSLSKTNTTQVLAGIQYLIAQGIGLNQGYLSYSSVSAIVFAPKNGATIRIAGTLLSIPAAGVSIANTGVEVNGTANQNLADSTTYDVYLKNVSGTLTPSFYTDSGGGTHMTDTTAGNVGTEVRSNSGTPDSTRTLIGKVLTNGSGQFIAPSVGIGVLSWFNRQQLAVNATVSTASTNSISVVSVGGSIPFITWGPLFAAVSGFMSTNAGIQCGAGIYLDGGGANGGNIDTTQGPIGASYFSSLSEGSHTLSIYGNNATGGSDVTTLTAALSVATMG